MQPAIVQPCPRTLWTEVDASSSGAPQDLTNFQRNGIGRALGHGIGGRGRIFQAISRQGALLSAVSFAVLAEHALGNANVPLPPAMHV